MKTVTLYTKYPFTGQSRPSPVPNWKIARTKAKVPMNTLEFA